jgi:hypothetical protein
MVLNMNRASLKLATVLPDRERLGDLALPGISLSDLTLTDLALLDLKTRTERDLIRDDPRQRRLDMEASIGIWAEREDLAETEVFLRNLREDDRSERFPAL